MRSLLGYVAAWTQRRHGFMQDALRGARVDQPRPHVAVGPGVDRGHASAHAFDHALAGDRHQVADAQRLGQGKRSSDHVRGSRMVLIERGGRKVHARWCNLLLERLDCEARESIEA